MVDSKEPQGKVSNHELLIQQTNDYMLRTMTRLPHGRQSLCANSSFRFAAKLTNSGTGFSSGHPLHTQSKTQEKTLSLDVCFAMFVAWREGSSRSSMRRIWWAGAGLGLVSGSGRQVRVSVFPMAFPFWYWRVNWYLARKMDQHRTRGDNIWGVCRSGAKKPKRGLRSITIVMGWP